MPWIPSTPPTPHTPPIFSSLHRIINSPNITTSPPSPFWSSFTHSISPSLWSFCDVEPTNAPISKNHWFSTHAYHPTTYSTQQTHPILKQAAQLVASSTTLPQTVSPKQYKAKKIRLLPSPNQRRILNQWFDGVRSIYNNCVELAARRLTGNTLTKKLLRHHFVNNRTLKDKWLLQVPYEVRDGAIADFQQARKAAFSLLRAGHIDHFGMSFRRRKSPSQSIHLRSRGWNGNIAQPFPTFWDGEPLRATELIPQKLPADCLIQKTWDGRYYLCLVEPLVPRGESQASGVVALDPGVRTFQTTYSPREGGLVTEWGNGDVTRIGRLCWSLDRLVGRMWSGECGRRKRAIYRKAAVRIRRKIKNLVRDIHCKLAKWLCEKYTLILLPSFDTSEMVQTGRRKIRSKTARMMLGWCHYQFKQRLVGKSRETGSKVVIVGEEYTSKTCGRCGEVNRKLGGSKVFRCREEGCGYEIDRDWNGARNILLKWVTGQR